MATTSTRSTSALGKILRFGRTRTLVALDLYNLFNSNPGLTYQQTFAPATATWLRCDLVQPDVAADPRFVRFNVTIDF